MECVASPSAPSASASPPRPASPVSPPRTTTPVPAPRRYHRFDKTIVWEDKTKALPAHLQLGDSLRVTMCNTLEEVAERIIAGGSVQVNINRSMLRVCRNLEVRGVVLISRCASLTSLSELLSARSLHVHHCPMLERLPHRMRVREDITLEGLEAMDTNLSSASVSPRRLRVLSCSTFRVLHVMPGLVHLEVVRCPALKWLPVLDGTIETVKLAVCDGLATLPPIKCRSLDVTECNGLTYIDSLINAHESLLLRECVGLKRISGPLWSIAIHIIECGVSDLSECDVVGNFVDIVRCPALVRLPVSITVLSLSLQDCAALEVMECELRAESVTLRRCRSLRQLCHMSGVTRSLRVIDCAVQALRGMVRTEEVLEVCACPALEEVRVNLSTNRALLNDLPALKRLDGRVHVDLLEISDCPALTSVRADLIVALNTTLTNVAVERFESVFRSDSVYIESATRLSELGHNFYVAGDLSIHDCSKLVGLWGSLELVGALVISHCPLLVSVTKYVSAGGVSIRGCMSMERISDTLTVDGTRSQYIGNERYSVYVEDCPRLGVLARIPKVAGCTLVCE